MFFHCLLDTLAATDQVYYYFNVSHINQTEEVLEAELHLYKLRPGSTSSEQQGRPRARPQASHIVDVSIIGIKNGSKAVIQGHRRYFRGTGFRSGPPLFWRGGMAPSFLAPLIQNKYYISCPSLKQ